MFSSKDSFELAQRMAMALAKSSLVPKSYQGQENLGNCMIAMDLASRMKANVLMVMQNLSIVEGKPAWSSKYQIASVNMSGRFSALRFEMWDDDKPQDVTWTEYTWSDAERRKLPKEKTAKGIRNRHCVAYAKDLATGDILRGPEVSIVMAIQERWYYRNGSKWQTLPELMLQYRAASFWTSIYAPEGTMGIPSQDDLVDAIDVLPSITLVPEDGAPTAPAAALTGLMEKARALDAPAPSEQNVAQTEPSTKDEKAEKPKKTPAPADDSGPWPRRDEASGETVDSRGVPWNESVHSKSCNYDGTWRRKRGVSAQEMADAEESSEKAAEAATAGEDEERAGEGAGEGDEEETEAGPTYADALHWIDQAVDEPDLDGALDGARDIPMSAEQRDELATRAAVRRAELAEGAG
jgi:hypothetical protein